MNLDLFSPLDAPQPPRESLAAGAQILRRFALPYATALLSEVEAIAAASPFRHLITPGGYRMSVAMTNCGPLGWVSDRSGYRYSPTDPLSGQPWPPMPEVFSKLALSAAAESGFPAFSPDACLINRYEPGAKLSLHRDADEEDFSQPIVSVSLGIPAVFLFGGLKRCDKTRRIQLLHGDVVVWGGPDRLRYHGVTPLKPAEHPLLGPLRINLTFRSAT